jgi:dihydrofolate reductase
MRVTMIAALDRARAIGRANDMPWHLPDDFRRFKSLTVRKPVIMGHRTAVSIGRALPDRPNIVLSRSQPPPFGGQTPARSLDEAIALATALDTDSSETSPEIIIAGGGEIYRLALPLASDMRLTFVDTLIDSPDTFFPAWDAAEWREMSRERHRADERHAYAFDWVWLVR